MLKRIIMGINFRNLELQLFDRRIAIQKVEDEQRKNQKNHALAAARRRSRSLDLWQQKIVGTSTL